MTKILSAQELYAMALDAYRTPDGERRATRFLADTAKVVCQVSDMLAGLNDDAERTLDRLGHAAQEEREDEEIRTAADNLIGDGNNWPTLDEYLASRGETMTADERAVMENLAQHVGATLGIRPRFKRAPTLARTPFDD